VADFLAYSVQSANEPGEHWQWLCYDNRATLTILITIIIIIIIKLLPDDARIA